MALAEIASKGLLAKALALVDVSDTGAIVSHVSPTSFFLLISMLTTCAAGAAPLARSLLVGGLHEQVHKLLAHSGAALANNRMTSAVRSQPQLTQVCPFLSLFVSVLTQRFVL